MRHAGDGRFNDRLEQDIQRLLVVHQPRKLKDAREKVCIRDVPRRRSRASRAFHGAISSDRLLAMICDLRRSERKRFSRERCACASTAMRQGGAPASLVAGETHHQQGWALS